MRLLAGLNREKGGNEFGPGLLGSARFGPATLRLRGKAIPLECGDVAGHVGLRAPARHACTRRFSPSSRRRAPAKPWLQREVVEAHLGTSASDGERRRKCVGVGAE
jgi:hypothetical protein